MPLWLIYTLLAALFAGITAVLAKYGIQEISADLGLVIRTAVIFVLVILNAFSWGGYKDWPNLTSKSILFLALSGTTAALSWIYYYRAIKIGPVSEIAAIDKSSILITILFSVWLLREPFTAKLALGAALILAGMLVLVWK